jgi:probable HAF family extracellular repeat protein
MKRLAISVSAMAMFRTVGLALGLTLLLAASLSSAQADGAGPYYIVRNLGTLGGTQGAAYGINNQGWVSGAANVLGDQNEHAFLWREGIMSDLGTAGGPNGSAGFPFKNGKGLVAAFGQTSTTDPLNENWNFYCGISGNLCEGTDLIQRGFLWADGLKLFMPTLGGNNNSAIVANDRETGCRPGRD